MADTSSQDMDPRLVDGDEGSIPPIEDATVFSCEPKSLGRRDTLTLRLATPHGGELSVVTPGEVTFFLVYPPLEDSTHRFSIVAGKVFETMGTLRIPADIRLPPYVFGKDTIPEAVFSRPGQYVMQMGERMESDHTGPPHICQVTFTP